MSISKDAKLALVEGYANYTMWTGVYSALGVSSVIATIDHTLLNRPTSLIVGDALVAGITICLAVLSNENKKQYKRMLAVI